MKDPHDFEEPQEPRVDVDGRTTTSSLAYCPIIQRSCGDVDCGRCEHLDEVIQELMPNYVWACAVCADQVTYVDRYWADGECGLCGFESCVLVLAKP